MLFTDKMIAFDTDCTDCFIGITKNNNISGVKIVK